MAHKAIAKNSVKSVDLGEVFPVESFWEREACVITFFRRFGWLYCRLAAKELSRLKPQLDARHVRLIGIGVDEVGVEEFVKEKFFSGELYVDIKKQCYKDMNYKRFNIFSIWMAVFNHRGRKGISKAREAGVGGDLKGDGFQNGGTLVVSAGGDKCLLSYIQENPAEHVELSKVLEALGISSKLELSASSSIPSGIECSNDICQKV